MAVVALKPRRGYSFTDHAAANPAAPPPGDRLDGEVDRIDRIGEILDWVSVAFTPTAPCPRAPAHPFLDFCPRRRPRPAGRYPS